MSVWHGCLWGRREGSWLWGMMGVTCGSTPRTWVPACAGKTEEVGCGMRRKDGVVGVALRLTPGRVLNPPLRGVYGSCMGTCGFDECALTRASPLRAPTRSPYERCVSMRVDGVRPQARSLTLMSI